MNVSKEWPSRGAYSELIVLADKFLVDNELKQAEVIMGRLGQPMCWSGQFAIVFKLTDGNKFWAVRCFISPVNDQRERYAAFHQHISSVGQPDCLVGFQYIHEGILVNGTWYPIVKMAWAEGETLDKVVEQAVNDGDSQALLQLSNVWLDVIRGLHTSQIAHGDLQHENILVHAGQIKLVDYDGTFVPSLHGQQALELGLAHYQHPRRGDYFGDALDNFASLVIYLTLRALAIDPTLWQYHKDKRLLLGEEDYKEPQNSPLIECLLHSQDREVRFLTKRLVDACNMHPADIPWLGDIVAETTNVRFLLPVAMAASYLLLMLLLATYLPQPALNGQEPATTLVPSQTVVMQHVPTLSTMVQVTPTPSNFQESAPEIIYVVKPGDTLWDVAEHYCGDGTKWRLVAEANGIDNPRRLQEGEVLTIPHC